MKYLYETHCHGSQCSRCAKSTTQELVRAYKQAGYAGLVLTDHFIYGNTTVSKDLSWNERMRSYYDAYLDAKKVGDALDFDVIFGFEHHYGGGKEMLVYGVGLDFLLTNPDIPDLNIDEFCQRVHGAGGIIVQAHPFRDRHYISDDAPIRPDLADGIEVYNAWNGPGENPRAYALAKTRNFILTSGGDVHADWDKMVGAAGVLLDRRVKTTEEFAQALKENRFSLRANFKDVWKVTEECL